MFCQQCHTPLMYVWSEHDGWSKVCVKCGAKTAADSPPHIKRAAAALAQKGWSYLETLNFDSAQQCFTKAANQSREKLGYLWAALLSECGVKYCQQAMRRGRSIEYIINFWKKDMPRKDVFKTSLYKKIQSEAAARGEEWIRYYDCEVSAISRGISQILDVQRQPEASYDVFLCFKDTDDMQESTPERRFLDHLHTRLLEGGLRVFYSPRSMEDKAVYDYEGYIHNALRSAKLMLVMTSSAENVDSPWVRSEWERFMLWNRDDRTRIMTAVIGPMRPTDFPDKLKKIQSESPIPLLDELYTDDILKHVDPYAKLLARSILDRYQSLSPKKNKPWLFPATAAAAIAGGVMLYALLSSGGQRPAADAKTSPGLSSNTPLLESASPQPTDKPTPTAAVTATPVITATPAATPAPTATTALSPTPVYYTAVTPTPMPLWPDVYAHILNDCTPLRGTPNADARIEALLDKNAVVCLIQQMTDHEGMTWYFVQHEDRWGFIRGDLLHAMDAQQNDAYKAIIAAPMPTPKTTPEPISENSTSAYAVLIKDQVNLRDAPSSSGTRLSRLPQNTLLPVIGEASDGANNWYHVIYNGEVCYVRSDMAQILTLAQLQEYRAEHGVTGAYEDEDGVLVVPFTLYGSVLADMHPIPEEWLDLLPDSEMPSAPSTQSPDEEEPAKGYGIISGKLLLIILGLIFARSAVKNYILEKRRRARINAQRKKKIADPQSDPPAQRPAPARRRKAAQDSGAAKSPQEDDMLPYLDELLAFGDEPSSSDAEPVVQDRPKRASPYARPTLPQESGTRSPRRPPIDPDA